MSWKTVALGELCEVLDSKRKPITKRDRTEGNYPYYGATGIVDYVGDYIFDEKLVLIGEDGAKWDSGEKTAFIADGKYWVNNHAHVIKPIRTSLFDEWLVYYFLFKDLKEFVTGLTVPKLNQGQLKNIPIPLPPLTTQQKIVAKLDAIFTEIDKATVAAEANIKNAEALFQNYLTGIFQSENSNFITKPIGEIGEIISGSGFPISEQGLLNEEIPFYKVSDMNLTGNENRMIFHNNSISRETAKKLGAKIIPPKSIIFPKIGGAIATNKKRVLTLPSCVDNNVMGIVPNEKLVKYEFFFHLISSIELSSLANEASLPSIKNSTVEERLVKIPQSLSEQEKVCKLLESLKNNSLSLRNGYMRKLNDLSSLKQSILKQAFNGELIKAA